jgi:DNA-binding CsgD family transcriptional regulator
MTIPWATDDAAPALPHAMLGGLNGRDLQLFRLHYVRGIPAQWLADELGISVPTVYVAMSRLRRRLVRCAAAHLVATAGAASCPRARELVDGRDGVLTPLLRKRLARHADGCDACRSLTAAVTADWVIETVRGRRPLRSGG